MTATAIQNLAAAKAIASLETARAEVQPGVYTDIEMTVTVRVDKMTIGKDSEFTPTVAVPLKAALAIALTKAGVQADNIEAFLVECMTEALEQGKLGDEAIKAHDGRVEAALETIKGLMGKLPKQTRKGAVRLEGIALEVEALESVAVPMAA